MTTPVAPDRVPASRRITNLGHELRATVDPVAAACLRIERAGLMARHGQVDEAKAELAAMRDWLARHPSDEVATWLAIAEGWLAHYTNMSLSAVDRMRRALTLARQAGLRHLQALSAAWLAHFSFFRDDTSGLAEYLDEAARLAEPLEHSTQARLSLVVATAWHFVERIDRATPWYALARHHALECGDEAMLSGLAFNIAANNSMHALNAAAFDRAPPLTTRRAMASVEAVGNFDEWVGMASLAALVPILRAMNASVAGDLPGALASYEAHLIDVEQQGMGHMQAVFLADMAWCRAQLGDRPGAESDVEAATRRLDGMQVEDLATAHARLAQACEALGHRAAAAAHRRSAETAWKGHQKLRAGIVGVLDRPVLARVLAESPWGGKSSG